MKKKLLIISLIFLIITGIASKYIIDRSMIFTGYAAKNLASGIFVAGRDKDDLEKNDLNFSLVSLASNRVDYENKIVYSDFFGFGKQTAIYRKGLGVCLVNEEDNIDEIKKQKLDFPEIPEWYKNSYWPKGNKIRNNINDIFDKEKLDKAINNAFEKGATRSIIVAYDTISMYEKYADGFNKDTKILGWSMSKSIASTMIGILQKEGKIDINKPAPIKEWASDDRKNITTRSLLNMTSGLKWNEDYGDISEATLMLYDKTNCSKFTIAQAFAYPPDSVWYYSSGSSNILTEIIKRQFENTEDYWRFPYDKLFHKISMYNTIMETDASANFVGSSYTYATSRDWARFGLLYLNNGIWFGDTIVNPEWVEFTQNPAQNSNGKYGSQFWLNSTGNELPDAPTDIYYADGYQGQRVYIIPSKKLVIVRMGLTTKKDFDYNKMIVEILNSLK
jgi:CubicO group peptidase (beta-lactamase class C family)